MKQTHVLLIFLSALLHVSLCSAIDNPDAPDYVSEFESRALSYENSIQNQGLAISDTNQANFSYEKFLDQELNQAYTALMKHIADQQTKKNLQNAQKRWLQFRDAEFEFIGNNWNQENFGTSYAITVGASRNQIIKDRVIQLLHYLKNY